MKAANRLAWVARCAWLAIAGCVVAARAADAPPADRGELDRQLFESSGAPPAATAAASGPKAIAEQMQAVSRRLANRDAGADTIALQSRIAAALRGWMEEQGGDSSASQSSSPGPSDTSSRESGGDQSPSRQTTGQGTGQTSTSGQSPGPVAADRTIRSLLDEHWGEMPPKAREQLLQATPAEQFLPKYREMIETYFRRLAEPSRSTPP